MKSAIAYLVVFLSVLGVGFARTRSLARAEAPAAAPLLVASAPPVASPPEREGFVGVLLAKQSVDVAPRVGSTALAVKIRAGDTVKRGDTLATLDGRDKAQALRMAAIAQRSQADRAARAKRLLDANLASAEEAQSATFEAERRSAELDLARVLVDDAVVRAPFDGVVVARFVDPGTHVAAGAPMFRLIDPHGARLRFGVPPAVADGLRAGDSVRFGAPGTSLEARARIASVAPEVDRSAGLVVVEADVADIGAFRSGSEIRVVVEGPGR